MKLLFRWSCVAGMKDRQSDQCNHFRDTSLAVEWPGVSMGGVGFVQFLARRSMWRRSDRRIWEVFPTHRIT